MLFDTLAFPWFFYNQSGVLLEKGEGSLLDLPNECNSIRHNQFYNSIKSGGWRNCHLGYAVYSHRLTASETSVAEPGILVLPGLKVKGMSTIQGRTTGLTLYTDANHIEKHVQAVLKTESAINDRFDQITRQNTHEIRGLNNGLYHAAEELRQLVQLTSTNNSKSYELAKSIIALSQILSIRLDISNYMSDEDMTETTDEPIPVYKKFDKIRKCFLSRAQKRGISIRMMGNSYSSTFGPTNSVEIIAYLLLDNAIKYSPNSCSINVHVSDENNRIRAFVSSIGPIVTEEESLKLFDLNFRGLQAEKSGRTGTGIGLNVLKRLVVDAFGGAVGIQLGDHFKFINGVSFNNITFTVDLPLHR